MEIGPTKEICSNPKHPYSEALLSAAPNTNPNAIRNRVILEGDIPSPVDPPSGCVFRTRCHYALDACSRESPGARQVSPNHYTSCIRDDIL